MRQLLDALQCARGLIFVAIATATPACQEGARDTATGELGATGTVRAALETGGVRHDVTAVRYTIVDASSACSDPPITEATIPLAVDAFPGGALSPGSGDHPGAEGLFVLGAGDYRICATPLHDALPSEECEPAEGTATVVPEATTELLLVSQCSAEPNDEFDPAVALDDPPTFHSVAISPGQHITQCETATLTVDATDPDGDEFSLSWELFSGEGTLSSAGDTATFTPTDASNAVVRVTATDVLGASSKFDVLIQVSAAVCPTTCATFGSDSFGYGGCSRIEAVTSCDDISATGSEVCVSDDCAATVPLPFPFNYYGTVHNDVNISANGILGFPVTSSYRNSCTLDLQTIAPFWTDLFPPSGTGVRSQTLGSEPTRRFVVQWNVPHASGTSLYDVRAVLFEGSNRIHFCYANTLVDNVALDSGVCATAGISGATDSLVFSCNEPLLTNGLVLEFTPPSGM